MCPYIRYTGISVKGMSFIDIAGIFYFIIAGVWY